MYPIPDPAPRRRLEESDPPSIRALTLDLDVHHDLLAVLIGAVDRLPGGSQAIASAIDELTARNAFAAVLSEGPERPSPMARHFIAAHAADEFDRATRAAQARPDKNTSREEDAHVE